MKKISILYICHHRTRYFSVIFNQLIKIKEENKKKINVNILVSKENDANINLELLTKNGIEANIIYLHEPGPGPNCCYKIKNAISISHEYVIVTGEDIFINNHIWDFMIENHQILDDEKNLLVSPLTSTGIPTVEWFINQFFNKKDRDLLFRKFKNTNLVKNRITPPGCEILNKCTVYSNNKEWDSENFYNEVSKLETDFKGLHPIRVSDSAQSLMVELVLKNKSKLLEKMKYKFSIDNNKPYFCNAIYMITRSSYKKIYEDKSLFLDSFDEVAINKFREKHNLNILYIENSFGIHPSYNWIGVKRYTELSDKFFKNIDDEFNIEDKNSISTSRQVITFPVPYDNEKLMKSLGYLKKTSRSM